jgi:hypothetical protein
MAWYLAYEKIRPYVVRVETIDGFGTGFLFAYNKDHSVAALATASHVIETAADWRQPIKVWHPESKKTLYLEVDDRAIWLDRRHDAASLLVGGGALKFPAAVLPLLQADKVKKIGVEVGWVGFPRLAPKKICFFSGTVSVHLAEEDSYLIDGVAINGVSGGPVFSELKDATPELIGVVSSYMANRRSGESLPGLLQAQDLTAFHDHIQKLKSLDEAKEKEKEHEAQKQREPQPPPPAAPSGA